MNDSTAPPQRNLFEWLTERRTPHGGLSIRDAEMRGVERDAARELQARLEASLGTVDLVVTDNRRRMVSARRRRDRHEIRVHHMFVGADEDVVDAIAALTRGERWAKRVIQGYIAEHHDEVRARATPSVTPDAAGTHHDLLAAFERARQEEALRDAVLDDVTIGWGRRGRGRRSIRFGSFDFEQRLVRIHPALDSSWVPEYFVDFVVYHELLHAVVLPKRDGAGRRILHPPEFRRLERAFSRYDEAIAWETDNLQSLLRR